MITIFWKGSTLNLEESQSTDIFLRVTHSLVCVWFILTRSSAHPVTWWSNPMMINIKPNLRRQVLNTVPVIKLLSGKFLALPSAIIVAFVLNLCSIWHLIRFSQSIDVLPAEGAVSSCRVALLRSWFIEFQWHSSISRIEPAYQQDHLLYSYRFWTSG